MLLPALVLSVLAPAQQNYQPLKVPGFFDDRMVLQAGEPITIWGTGEPRTRVHLTIAAEADWTETLAAAHGNVGANGRWSLQLPAQEASYASYRIELVGVGGMQIWEEVQFGEVWFAAGQSNMEWPMSRATGWNELRQRMTEDHRYRGLLSRVRFYDAQYTATGGGGAWSKQTVEGMQPHSFRRGKWSRADEDDFHRMSAVAWYFAHFLQRKLDCPVGVIEVAAGGTPTEAWVDPAVLAAQASTSALVAEGSWLDNPALSAWCRDRARQNLATAFAEGWQIPGNERGPHHVFQPGYMWQVAVQPFTRLPIAGVIWYQGESNAGSAERVAQHEAIFRSLRQSWRKAWNDSALPFLTVQLPGMDREHWPAFREQQRQLQQEDPRTGMAVTIDLGDPRDVHPRNKRPVGKRLARTARALVYGHDILHTGPIPQSIRQLAGDRLRIGWAEIGAGMAQPEDARGFEWQDADGNWHPFAGLGALQQAPDLAPGRVRELELLLPAGAQAKVVRYLWAHSPTPTLYDSSLLPAGPFVAPVSD